jgi:hypothetical protein
MIYSIYDILLMKNNYLYYSKIYAYFLFDRKVYKEQIMSLWKIQIYYRLINKNLWT